MRQATESDVDFVVECYVKIARHYESRRAGCLYCAATGSTRRKPSASSGGYLGRIAVGCRASKPRSGTAAKLVSAAEDWLRQKEVGVVELSYMIKKELAAISGRWLGYQPFRVFAYKEL